MGFSFKNRAHTHVLTMSGYALNPAGNELAGGVIIEIDGVPYRAYYGMPIETVADMQNPDVAKISKDPELRDCGFRREFSRQ